MYLVCGLGNPGREYERTRHNLGFIAVDALASRLDIKPDRLKFKALLGEGRVGGEKVILAKPQTFMNLSGEAVRPIAEYYAIPPEKIIIICDDIDLEVGNIRVRARGSAGSHNGLKSVIYQLQTQDFPRIRIGTGQNGNIPLVSYVLGKWTDAEEPVLSDAVKRAAEAAETLICAGVDSAMAKFNAKLRKNAENN